MGLANLVTHGSTVLARPAGCASRALYGRRVQVDNVVSHSQRGWCAIRAASADSWRDDQFLTRRQPVGDTLVESTLTTLQEPRGNSAIAKSRTEVLETWIEKRILDSRFLTLLAVVGSLFGSTLCFSKGCLFVFESFVEFYKATFYGSHGGTVIFLLVEALDVYLIGTVMLIFAMGLYELFINTLDVPAVGKDKRSVSSNFFGLFQMVERPPWLETTSLAEMKTKLGHVIVMILLVGLFEKSKKVPIKTSVDFLFLSTAILFASCCLFLLSKLHNHSPPA